MAAGGWDALEPKSRRPRTNPNATPPDVVDRILALRAELIADGCDAGPHSIAGILEDEMPTPPGVTTIWRILTRAGVITPEPRKRPKRSWIRFAADLPNECWQADFTHITLADGTDTEVLLWVDDHYNHRRKHRSLNRRRPAEVYAARAKATPDHNAGGHFRIRDDTADAGGSVTLRRGGRMHHIKLGIQHARVRMLVHDLHVIVIDRDTGEVLRELTINPDKDSQPRGVKPGPRPGHRKGGMPKGYTYPPK